MELYIVKPVACLGIFFLFYKLLLENTSLHKIKRFFLLASLFLSLAIPFITFTEYVEAPQVLFEEPVSIPVLEVQPITINPEPTNYLPFIFGGIYILGVVIFGIRFGKNLFQILRKADRNEKQNQQGIFHVLLKLPVTPHSFFNYIFFNRAAYEADAIPREVIWHETAHVKQKHSWDILAIELLQVVFWFNPLLYFMKHSIKLNHEFLADRSVLQRGTSASNYQNILLDFSSTSSVPVIAHSINYSSIKKRFTVMKTHTSKRASWLKGLLVLPLLAVIIYGFSKKEIEYTYSEIPKTKTKTEKILDISISENNETIVNHSIIALKDLETIVLSENYTTAALYVSEKASVSYAKSVVTKLVRLELANHMSVCTSSDGGGGLSNKDLNEIMSPLSERFKNTTKEKGTVQKTNANSNLSKNQTWQKDFTKQFNEGFKKDDNKKIIIAVTRSQIRVNGKETSIKNFAKAIDNATKDWNKTDFEAANPSVLVASTPTDFIEQLHNEFKKTRYYKLSGKNIIPLSPPPPPPAPDAPSGELKNLPPPPPPAPKGEKVKLPPQAATPPKPTLKMTLFDPPNLGPQLEGKNPQEILEAMLEQGVTVWSNGGKLTKKESRDLIKQHKYIVTEIQDSPHDVPSIIFTDLRN